MKKKYDCVVIGGGPAGTAAAALLAEGGCDTLLLEREKVPRFHVGESLMPETYWIFERLGVLDKMQNSSFVKKVSVQFVSHTGKQSQPFFFKQHDPRESSQTWQVERSKFDKMLFDNAAEKGAECCDETRVLDIHFDGQRATGIRVQTAAGQSQDIESRVIVDATGQQALMANRLGLRVDDPTLRKVAIWGYYQNAHRDEGENGGATVILQTNDQKAWFWYIPLSNNITSIGVVGDTDYLLKGRGTPSEVFLEELEKCENMQGRLQDATLTSEFRVAKEFSYATTQRAGNGWVLTGDAYGFIDPIYSSGVYFALRTGELAADAIIEGFQKDDLSAEQLGKWTKEFDQGSLWIRKLVSAYYSKSFSFGRFLKEHPMHTSNLTDLLIGRIFYDGAGKIFDDMDPALAKSM
ncbi:MAG: flavin-dependent dehydrogenase [Pirellulaceae bacterium]|jgi:flavin-dependent dehydrogenase